MRLNKFVCLMMLVIGCVLKLSAQEIRLGAETDYKISKKIKTEFLFQQRFAEHNMQSQRSSVIQGKLRYKQNKYISYALGVRYKKELNLNTENGNKNNDKIRLTGDVKLKIPEHIKNVSLFNRVRFQQTRSEDHDAWFLIRNQLAFKYKYSKVLSTNVSYELFYNTNSRALELGRLRFKVDHELTTKLAISGFFTIDSPLQNNKFDHYYIYGLQLKYSI